MRKLAIFIFMLFLITLATNAIGCQSSVSPFLKDRVIQIGNSSYVLSRDAQRYLEISEVSNYQSSKSVLIIEEPHWDLGSQYNLYKGLEIFFEDNPTLANGTVFLAEGFPSGKYIYSRPLIQANASPSEELIIQVLSSYLITGYIAYEWKYQKGIPIIGSENEKLYELSARLWVEAQASPDNTDISDIWYYTVVARVTNIAKLLIEIAEIYENPILFTGGLHLYAYNNDDFQRMKSKIETYGTSLDVGESQQYLDGWDNLGIIDYLEKEKIGYTFITIRASTSQSWAEDEISYNTYLKLFEAQQSGDYAGYIEWLTSGSPDIGVTVRPSVEAAAALVRALTGSSADGVDTNHTNQEDNEEQDNEDKNDHDNDGGNGGPHEAQREGNDLEEGAEISEQEAVERVENEEKDVKARNQDQAESIAREASDGKDPVFEWAHDNGYYNHYHTWDHGDGHVFFGEPVFWN